MLWSKSPDSKSSHAKSLDAKCPDAKALDVKSQSKSYQKEEPESPQKLVPVLERLKTSNHNRKSNSNPNTFISEADTDNESDTRQIDSNRKVKSQNNNEDYNCFGYMNFSSRDSDEDDTKDFGTFRSLYGGHGLMEPFDWSVITDENNLSHKTTMPDNLDMSIRKHNSEEEDKLEDKSHNQKNEIPGKQYFLSMTCMEKENFVSENNIDYDVKNMSDFIEMLRDKTAPNIVTVMFAPNNKFGASQDSSQSEDTSNSSVNIVELNDVTSSTEMDQKINGNGKVCEISSDQKMKNTDSNTDSESVLSNMSIHNAKGNIIGEMSECDTSTSLDSNLNNKVYHPKYKMLLDKMRRKQRDVINSNFVNASESSSSEQIQSSSSNCNTSDDTIISSNDEQSKTSNNMDTNNHKMHSLKGEELKSTSEEPPKNLTLNESHNYSETDFITSSDIDDVRRRRRLNRSFSSDSSVSACNVDDSCQSNTIDRTKMNVHNKLMQQMLKIVQNINNTELDSDDLSSSRESVKSDESDESKRDDKAVKSDHVFQICKSMDNDVNQNNVTEITPPIYNDCDVESDDSEWDAYAGSIEDFPYFLFTSRDPSTQITEIKS